MNDIIRSQSKKTNPKSKRKIKSKNVTKSPKYKSNGAIIKSQNKKTLEELNNEKQ